MSAGEETEEEVLVHPVRNPAVRWLVRYSWAPILLSVAIELSKAAFHPNYNLTMVEFRFSIYVLFVVMLGLMSHLTLRQLPGLFRSLTQNRVIDVAYARELGGWLTRAMNSPLAHLAGLALTVAIQVPVWRGWLAANDFAQDWPLLMDPGIWLITYLMGLGFWNGAHVGWFLIRFGIQDRFTVRALHPDKSGGLAKAGELCFFGSLVVVVQGLFCSWWFFTAADRMATYMPLLQFGLVSSIGFSLVVFLLPLWFIHRAMVRQAKEIDARFRDISAELALQRQELVISGDRMTRQEFDAALERVRFLESVSGGEFASPRWPVPTKVWVRFLTSLLPIGAGIYQFWRSGEIGF